MRALAHHHHSNQREKRQSAHCVPRLAIKNGIIVSSVHTDMTMLVGVPVVLVLGVVLGVVLHSHALLSLSGHVKHARW